MQGINIVITQENNGLVINNLTQSKGIEFKVVKFKGKRKSLDNAEIKETFTISNTDYIVLANALKKHADLLQEKAAEKEKTKVKFFDKKEKELNKENE